MRKSFAFIFATLVFLSSPVFGDGISIPPPYYFATTWTPTITTDGTVGTPAYSVQVGSYEQIGRQITARFTINLSGWTGSPTGNVSLAGLPFASNSASNDYAGCVIYTYVVTGLTALNYGITGRIVPGTQSAVLFSSGNTTIANITAAQFGSTGSIIGACFYRV